MECAPSHASTKFNQHPRNGRNSIGPFTCVDGPRNSTERGTTLLPNIRTSVFIRRDKERETEAPQSKPNRTMKISFIMRSNEPRSATNCAPRVIVHHRFRVSLFFSRPLPSNVDIVPGVVCCYHCGSSNTLELSSKATYSVILPFKV